MAGRADERRASCESAARMVLAERSCRMSSACRMLPGGRAQNPAGERRAPWPPIKDSIVPRAPSVGSIAMRRGSTDDMC